MIRRSAGLRRPPSTGRLAATTLVATTLACVVASAPATAEPARFGSWYSVVATQMSAPALTLGQDGAAASKPAPADEAPKLPPEAADEDGDSGKPAWANPFSCSITYSLYSDYVSRAMNLSEYPGEGREDPNHQLTTSLGVDLAVLFGREEGEFGSFTFDTFFEWYAGQDRLDLLYGAHNLQEIDYGLSYSYEFKPLYTTATIGYLFYAFPNHREIATQEWTASLEHNDAWMWEWLFPGNEDGVLNPYVTIWQDTELISRGAWWQFGFSHDFELTEEVILTPSLDFGIDNHWIHPTFDAGIGTIGFASAQYGLTLSYDLSELAGLKKWGFGSLVWSGFVYYSDALGNPRDDDLTADWFYGGTSIGWSF
ncbi:MAG: hypothetical protein HZB38_03315 [Planctomycetes bacterium]|nr:hypothetical protein [Planctomycetota bacterium]